MPRPILPRRRQAGIAWIGDNTDVRLPPLRTSMVATRGTETASYGPGAVGGRDEVRTRAGNEDSSIQAYDRDLRSKLAWYGPDLFKALDGVQYMTATLAAKLLAFTPQDLAQAAANMQGKSAARVQQEQTFYAQWFGFYARWRAFDEQISGFDVFGPSPEAAWQQIDAFDSEYTRWRDQAAKLFQVVPSTPLPVPPQTVEAEHMPDTGMGWGWTLFLIALAGAGIYFVTKPATQERIGAFAGRLRARTVG